MASLPVVANDAQLTALRGNHSTSGHRATLADSYHPDASITTDSKLDVGKVIAKCPAMEPVLMTGAMFTVIPSCFLNKYEGLTHVIISSGNVMNNVAQAERDLQIMCENFNGMFN